MPLHWVPAAGAREDALLSGAALPAKTSVSVVSGEDVGSSLHQPVADREKHRVTHELAWRKHPFSLRLGFQLV